MADFFAELKRRHIYRVGAAYVVVAWALTQVIDVMSQIFELPGWIAQPTIIVLAMGLPIALVAAWIIESKPHQAVASAVKSKPTIVDWSLFGALVVVLLFMGYRQLAPSSEATRQSGVDTARSVAAAPGSPVSLAVLPFANLSGDPSQEFFSDGITEEITSVLARVPDLRVVARSSAYQFRDQNRDIQSIGQQLHATHFIEGSVRRAGARVRITAQLIKADDATHVWAETFDRELTDIFAIQEDIATAIAGSLRVPLGLKPGQQLVANRSIDPESYQQFLRAKALLLRGRGAARDAIATLEPVVAANPNYAPAWGGLAFAYFLSITTAESTFTEEGRRTRETYLSKVEAAAQRARALDPTSLEGQLLTGLVQTGPRKWVVMEDALSKALTLDPNRAEVMNYYSSILLASGRVKEALVVKRQLRELEPFVPLYEGNLAQALWLDGHTEEAVAILKENLGRQGAGAGQDLARIYASQGRFEEAADVISQYPGAAYVAVAPTAARVLRAASSKVSATETLPSLGRLGFFYLYIGPPERALDFYEQAVAVDPNDIAYLWHTSYAPLRKTERFKAIIRQNGLVDYWRERGWPAQCHPTTGDDFACD